jgi:spore maturation protein CgeB
MKILKLTSFYPDYIEQFYLDRKDLFNKSYNEQKEIILYDEFGWGDFWSHTMNKSGYEMVEIFWNIKPLQRQWAIENGFAPDIELKSIAIEQIKKINPDVLWYEENDNNLIDRIRNEVKSIRLVLGWAGSFISKSTVWKKLDIVLSCAPESVYYFRQNGIKSELLSHAFDPRINQRLVENDKKFDVSFIGQINREIDFHLQREKILEKLSSKIKLQIFSASANYSNMDNFKQTVWKYIFRFMEKLNKAGIPSSTIRKIPKIGKVITWEDEPIAPVSSKLIRFMKPAVYGLKMFQSIKDSNICLNVHADSSPKYASNMRMFEITGVGTCMVMDWKENVTDFFEPEKEVITYKSTGECIDKIHYLIDHPEKMDEIAKAGQMRTLKDHTFEKRAMVLVDILKKHLIIN